MVIPKHGVVNITHNFSTLTTELRIVRVILFMETNPNNGGLLNRRFPVPVLEPKI